MNYDVSTKAQFDGAIGKRSGLKLRIDREHEHPLLPSIDTSRICLCIDHGITTIVEKLLEASDTTNAE